jgi:DNA polymerase-3 subunit gamma/tau
MSGQPKTPYRVLARKYRPQNFDQLIGQDALVRTLKNAIESGRIAQAYMLTGIRGTGKTTTARIIAKALNYTGADGKAGPTTGSTDDCSICRSITEDRHPDVLEMDAASHTGVDDIREILDGVRYAPGEARYKIYIIDEVHMLSKNAFNALLKTLEEPPPHVKFIFATTEIRKVPVTVLSRCQRFDLKRVDAPTLAAYYGTICEKENVTADAEALAAIARAADGSVRDGLSLLDQAISLGGDKVTAAQVREMLGLSDRGRIPDLLDHALKGECAEALAIMADMYRSGADPSVVLQDMLEFTHILTRRRAVPQVKGLETSLTPDASARVDAMAASLSMPALSRAWQVILKGLSEVATAPDALAAAEMIVIRLAYAADLPDPADLLRKLKNQKDTPVPVQSAPVVPQRERAPEPVARMAASGGGGSVTMAAPQEIAAPVERLETLQDVVALLHARKEMILAGHVVYYLHLVKMQEGLIEVRLEPDAPPAMTQELRSFLISATGRQWMVSISGAPGAPTLAQQKEQAEAAMIDEAKRHPVVQAAVALFPGAEISIHRGEA